MKFALDNIDEYDGSDLIILTGVPGSRWSGLHRMVCENPAVNTTDWSEDRSWNTLNRDVHGEIKKTGGHRGSYWGPGNMFGDNFEFLHKLTKKQILKEFMDAYDSWHGIKIVKSHWFAYNIPYLRNLFPKAKIVCCYVNDIEAFFWWHHSGGWGLGYANYAWYENDNRMLEKIKEENSNILKYAIDRDIPFKYYRRSELWKELGLPDGKPRGRSQSEIDGDPLIKVKASICDGSFIPNFYHLTSSESSKLRTIELKNSTEFRGYTAPVNGYEKGKE